MSLNYAFGFFFILLLLVIVNFYFFYVLTGYRSSTPHLVNVTPLDTDPHIIKEIDKYLYYLAHQFRSKNAKFSVIQHEIINSFNSSSTNINLKNVWQNTEMWAHKSSLFPNKDGAPGQILQAMQISKIAYADNAPKGTQLKLLLLTEGKQMLFFKPKRYNLEHIINGNIYAGFDRHNSEVFGYYLAMVMNFTWIAPSVIRKINVAKEIVPVASISLQRAMTRNNGTVCIYGKCYYCKVNETVCPDQRGEIEGAVILYLDKPFRIYKHPWRRSYSSRKMEWEKDDGSFCKKIKKSLRLNTLLNLIDISIFDYLIQNGDRHRYEVYKDKVVILDNGKGLGNPMVDVIDILAPLYQCCILRMSTWNRLELLSGGSLTETILKLASLKGEKIITHDHVNAIERRLLKVYAAVQLCIGKYGSAKVFKNDVEYFK